MKSRETAALLAILPCAASILTGGSLGFLNGLHYIYIGGRYKSKGITWLVWSLVCAVIAWALCWLLLPLALLLVPFIFSIIGLIDGIKMFGMTDEQFQQEYGTDNIY